MWFCTPERAKEASSRMACEKKKSSLGKAGIEVFQLSFRTCLKHWRLPSEISGDNIPSPMVLVLSHSFRELERLCPILSSFTCSWNILHPDLISKLSGSNIGNIALVMVGTPLNIAHFIFYVDPPNSVILLINKTFSYHMLSRYQVSRFSYSGFDLLSDQWLEVYKLGTC